MPNISHSTIIQFHSEIAAAHKGINGFYRMNWAEIANSFRSGIPTPALVIESHSSELQSNGISTFNHRAISFMLLDHTGKPDNYARQEEVLDELEAIGLEIARFLDAKSKTTGHWMYGLYDRNSFKMEKVGPIMGDMYGWNILYEVKSKETMVMNADSWEIPAP